MQPRDITFTRFRVIVENVVERCILCHLNGTHLSPTNLYYQQYITCYILASVTDSVIYLTY